MSMDRLQYQSLKIKHNRYKNPNSYQHPWLSKITAYFCHCQQRKQMYSFIKTWQLTYRLAWSKTTMNTSSTPIQHDLAAAISLSWAVCISECRHQYLAPLPAGTTFHCRGQRSRKQKFPTHASDRRAPAEQCSHIAWWSKQWINL